MDVSIQPTYVNDPYIPVTETGILEITRWIIKRHISGILLGPFTDATCPFEDLHFSPLFTVLKPDFAQRVVCHLSYPTWGTSVNDCIPDEAKAVSYISFAQVAKFVYSLGYGAQLWVVDAKEAFYRVPIKKKYWKYMGIKWFGIIFVFTSLHMGLGSACAIYERFADAYVHIMRYQCQNLFISAIGSFFIFHYLDDVFGGHPKIDTAWQQILYVVYYFWALGIPTQWKKVRWPSCRQVILGWEYNTELSTYALPRKKQLAYIGELDNVIREFERPFCKKELEHLNGILEHASVGIYPGKAKTRNIQYAMHLELFHYEDSIILSDIVITDLKWWRMAIMQMNGVPLKWAFSTPDVYHDEYWSDAAVRGERKLIGGMGACSLSGVAYQVQIEHTFAQLVAASRSGLDIKLFEFMALLAFVIVNAHQLRFKNVRLWCDNDTVVWAVSMKRGPLKRRDLHWMVNILCELSVKFHFRFWIEFIKGKENVIADRLSRFKDIYHNHAMSQELEYIPTLHMMNIINDLLMKMLNFKKCPRNYDDPLRVHL